MQTKTTLIAPLNWGLGHATRCVPVIKSELNKGHRVVLAADGAAFYFLKAEFPNLTLIKLGGYQIKYASKPWFILVLLLQLPLFYLSLWREHFQLRSIIKQFNITQIISDNRYGLWHRKVESILITHQPFVKVPFPWQKFEPALHCILRKWIERFNTCWIPDFENIERSLSGALSHGDKLPKNAQFIGPLSRFQPPVAMKINSGTVADVFIIISGPEPLRSRFEQEMELRFAHTENKVLMVTGKPGNAELAVSLKVGVVKVPHLDTESFLYQLKFAKKIIARSGYSTIMDLWAVERTAELIPTPGQTEQEYLANWYRQNHNLG